MNKSDSVSNIMLIYNGQRLLACLRFFLSLVPTTIQIYFLLSTAAIDYH